MARFGAHHAFLLTAMLARVDAANADIAGIEEQITVTLGESHDAASRLVTIPRIGACLAVAIIAEIGVDMSRFPTAGHLCSWAKFAPVTQESAGKARARPGTGHVNKDLARSLGEAAVMAGRSDTFLGARYRRIARRRGRPRAIVAVSRSLLVAIWHILSTPGATFIDLGADYYESRINPERRVRNHVRGLQPLGYRVALEPAA